MGALFNTLASLAAGELLRRAGEDGEINLNDLYELQAAIGLMVTRVFLSQVAAGRSPFQVLPSGEIFPTSSYSRVLFDGIRSVKELAIQVQQNVVTKILADRPGLLGQARRSFDVFTNPLATYDPAHLWVSPDGYTLSERIWRTSGQTRRKIDLFLDERIRQGQGARDMARDLETFLQPGRKLKRTKAPYGTDASFDAMRLARTEVTRAHAGAFEAAARENPYVIGLDVVLSGSHPRPDICDEAAAGGPYLFEDGGVPAVYQIPLHPQCLCSYRNVLVDRPLDVTRRLLGVAA